jgi:hypothetical protein
LGIAEDVTVDAVHEAELFASGLVKDEESRDELPIYGTWPASDAATDVSVLVG